MGIRFNQAKIRWQGVPVLTGIDCEIPNGSLCLLTGPNGSGKSSFLKAIVQDPGIDAQGVTSSEGASQMAYLPQNSDIERKFPITAGEFLEISLLHFPRPEHNLQESVLSNLKLAEFMETPLEKLTGGQFQRLLLARILLQGSQVLVLDEPFNFMDQDSIRRSITLLKEARDRGLTVVLALHQEVAELLKPDLILCFHEGYVHKLASEPSGNTPRIHSVDHAPVTFH